MILRTNFILAVWLAEYTGWLVAIFTSERVFLGSLFFTRETLDKLSSTLDHSQEFQLSSTLALVNVWQGLYDESTTWPPPFCCASLSTVDARSSRACFWRSVNCALFICKGFHFFFLWPKKWSMTTCIKLKVTSKRFNLPKYSYALLFIGDWLVVFGTKVGH